MGYITQAEIARRAGVSRNTVSLALRNSPRISEDCRRRVHRISTELGYHVDPAIAQLMLNVRARRSVAAPANLAVVADCPAEDCASLSLQQYLQGVIGEAGRLNYAIDHFELEKWSSGRALSRMLAARGVRGIFLCNYRSVAKHGALDWGRFSWMIFGTCRNTPECACVAPDCYHVGEQILGELWRRGYRRPAFAMPEGRRWLSAYLVKAHVGGIPTIPTLGPRDWNREAFLHWLGKHKPDIVLSRSDVPLLWMRESCIQVPGRMGFLHLNAGASMHGASGMSLDYGLAGRSAVWAMDGLIRRHETGVPSVPVTYAVPASWTEGETIRPASDVVLR